MVRRMPRLRLREHDGLNPIRLHARVPGRADALAPIGTDGAVKRERVPATATADEDAA